MRLPIRLTLILLAVFVVSALVLGAMVPTSTTRPSASPYLSALSDLAVKPALAVTCNTTCVKSQGTYHCVNTGEITGTACHLLDSGRQCEYLVCP
jgi:hypothetical protein